MTLLFPERFRPLGVQDLPLVCLVHNDLKFLRSLLAHYRGIGATRFIFVDDGSTDGTLEFLRLQTDVDIWVSDVRYKDARRGRLWREKLFATYGKDRWYLNIDSDEYLVYQDYALKPLQQLLNRLELQGVRRLSAPMIDMYPPGPVSEFPFQGMDNSMPWEIASCFDGDGYVLERTKRFLSLSGGARHRKFGSEVELMKYPLIYWDDDCSLGTTIHKPLPYSRNFFPISAALLHFKFFSDYKEKTTEAVADKQYFAGASEYQKILNMVSKNGDVDFVYGATLTYGGPEELARQGFIRSVWT